MKDFALILVTLAAALSSPSAGGTETLPFFPSPDTLPSPPRDLPAQDIIPSVLYLTGASDPSELDTSELERFESLSRHPIPVNRASRTSMMQVLSPWQAASVEDYRERHGNILSWTELSAVDGFDRETVEALRPFLSLETGRAPGRDKDELLSRSSLRCDEGSDPGSAWALKYRHVREDRWSLALTAKNAYPDAGQAPSAISGHAALYGSGRHFRQLLVGDYYARFAYGLGIWNGFSLSGINSLQAFRRRGGGLSPAWTVSPGTAFRGAAASWDFGRWSFTPLVSAGDVSGPDPQLLAALNTTRLGRRSVQSLTVMTDRTGAGERLTRVALSDSRTVSRLGRLGPLDLGAEAACDLAAGAFAAVTTAVLTPAYGRRIAMLLRWYEPDFQDAGASAPRSATHSSDEAGAAFGIFMPRWQSSLDVALKPSTGQSRLKSLSTASLKPSWLPGWTLCPRLSVTWRETQQYPLRCDLRLDAGKTIGDWQLRLRADAVSCRSLSRLYYAEAGRNTETFSCYARAAIFAVDRWDDRIYCYERDVPGYFNVPAYYGRGLSASVSGALTLRSGTRPKAAASDASATSLARRPSGRFARHRLCWRLSVIHYTSGPLTGSGDSAARSDKPDRIEARIQYVIDL